MTDLDVVVIGAGGAGLMCALTAGRRGQRVLIIDHASKIGEKIRISGGGRCNFTNLHTTAENFLSENPHFCRSALARFGPQSFIDMVEQSGIAYHEKTLGQLFCDNSAQEIIRMLLAACDDADVQILSDTKIRDVRKLNIGFSLKTRTDGVEKTIQCTSLVVATGGLSIPKIGATDVGYRIAKQFGLNVIPPRPGLVPFVFDTPFLHRYAELSGVSLPVAISCNGMTFAEALLFTHRGLSGPAVLQISSYWREGDIVSIDLSPDTDVYAELKSRKESRPRQTIETVLTEVLPKRLAKCLCQDFDLDERLAETSDKALRAISSRIHDWCITPSGTEGYRTAEVTVGGVDTAALSSKTMECRNVPGLYFVGEVIDVTGHLGGFNFQWAWASGHAAGSAA